MAVIAIPIPKDRMTTASSQPLLPALLNPYNIRPNPAVDKRTLPTSSFDLEVSDTLTKYLNANAITIRTSGMRPINSQRQEWYSIMNPESVGPMAGAKIIASPSSPMALPRFSTGKMASTTLIMSGIIMPAPAA
ncbi:hypothetical protein D3C81_1739740 [compost metagenome]